MKKIKKTRAEKIIAKFVAPKKPGKKGRLRDWQLADIFYLLVHDFDIEMIEIAKNQMKYPEDCAYREYLTKYEWIYEWAKRKGYSVVERRAKRAVEEINRTKK